MKRTFVTLNSSATGLFRKMLMYELLRLFCMPPVKIVGYCMRTAYCNSQHCFSVNTNSLKSRSLTDVFLGITFCDLYSRLFSVTHVLWLNRT